MKLTALEIHGFKSFADRTKLAFDHGVTAIVGPNGCGKSNVIDAIRWVLGEQKTRNLRSEKMEDVLFNGTAKRKRAHLAEVAITFQNDRGRLPAEYDHVTISRKLYRDGDSEYQINGVSCRLKDIQQLFSGTGLGADSYAIIELGMVKDLLQDKGNARRAMLEEAAGILGYKQRKKETLSKLEDTQRSLDRVEDVLHEIDRNLKQLERQAKRAEQYREVRAKYQRASYQLALLKVHGLNNRRQALRAERETLQRNLAEAEANLAKLDVRTQDLQHQAASLDERLRHARHALATQQEAVQKEEREKLRRQERQTHLTQRLHELQERLGQHDGQAAALRERVDALTHELAQAETTQQDALASRDQRRTTRDQRRTQAEQARQAVDQARQTEREAEQALTQAQKAQDLLTMKQQNLDREAERLETEQQERQQTLQRLQTDGKAAVQALKTHQATLDEAQQRVEAHAKALEETNAAFAQAREAVYEQQRLVDATAHDYEMTKDLVDSLEGFPESVRFLKQHKGWPNAAPLVSDLFNTDEAYKVAIEAYLEPYMGYLVAENRNHALEGLHVLKKAGKGRVGFLLLEALAKPFAEDPTPLDVPQLAELALVPALSVVDYPEVYAPVARYLLGHVYLSPDGAWPPGADRHAKKLDNLVVLAQSGEVLHRRYSSAGGSVGLFAGKRIGRAQRVKTLNKELKQQQQELESRRARLKQLREQLDALQREKPQHARDQAQRALGEAQGKVNALDVRLQEGERQLTRLAEHLKEVRAERAQLQQELDAQQEAPSTLGQTLAARRQATQHATEAALAADAELKAAESAYHQADLARVEAENRTQSIRKELDASRHRLDQLAEEHDTLSRVHSETQASLGELAGGTQASEDRLVGLYQDQQRLADALNTAEEEANQLQSLLQQNDQQVRQARNHRDDVLARRAERSEQLNQVESQRQAIDDRLQMEFQVKLDALKVQDLFETPSLDEVKPEPLEAELNKLRERLGKFTDVNPMAVEAYEEMKERHDFIVTQRDDLTQARKDLLTTINELDTTAQERFMETFEAVRGHFHNVFRSLFTDEDTCDLKLTKPEEPLESGIDIMARPKGKRPLSINQLSGGEMTLTAIAFLFSIYLLKPAPFCVFDEVDAPLDDANIDKFNGIIRDFANQSQFILVTHNKRTMASTNVMYGVTMEEPGISRLLPVQWEKLGVA